MIKKKTSTVISIILFVLALIFVLIIFLVPYLSKTDKITEDNTFMNTATVSEIKENKDNLEIYLDNERVLVADLNALKDKKDLINEIKSGDTIVFWTLFGDTYNESTSPVIPIWAFSVNDTPILTIEEVNRNHVMRLTITRIFTVVIAAGFIAIGVVLLVRAYKKPKVNTVPDSE